MSDPFPALHERNLIVLSAGRSGSSLLVNYLNSNRRIHCHGEVLNSGHEIYGTVEGKTKEQLIKHVASFFPKSEATYVGAKFLTHQFDELDATLQDVLEVLRNPKVIAMYRRSLLETFISLQIAEQNDIWYSSQVVNDTSVALDLKQFCDFAEVQRGRWQRSMQAVSQSCSVLCVTYEELVSAPTVTMDKIFAFLEIPSVPVTSESVKQNPGDLRSKISNYTSLPPSELAAAASGSLELSPCGQART